MHLSHRLKIIGLFVLLVMAIYITLLGVSGWFWYSNMTSALDDELTALETEILPLISLHDQGPELGTSQQWNMKGGVLFSLSLYDSKGMLVKQVGPQNIFKPLPLVKEMSIGQHTFRLLCKPLKDNGRLVGWLQIVVPTTLRDMAFREFAEALLLFAPVLFLTLLAAGYFFSTIMIKPIDQALSILKQFMTDASHELKTPLAISRINIEALEQELLDKKVLSHRIGIAVHSLAKMTQLIEDITLLANMENPSFQITRSRVAVDKLVQLVVDDFSEQYKQKGISLECEVGSDIPEVLFAPDHLEKAVANLLDNAWRYTSPGGTVRVMVRNTNHCVQIIVTDTGVGIPPDLLPAVFERFYRVDASHSRQSGGTGLGLAIVKALVESHGGNVSAQSVPGKGSTFTITLPLA